MKLIITILLFQCINCISALGQIDSGGRKLPMSHNYYSIDTMIFNSGKIKVTYTLVRTDNLKDKFFRKGELIFNDSVNKSSKIFVEHQHQITVSFATIPIDNLVIDDSNELILGLSRAQVSPYHIVLYNFKGELLFKKQVSMFELVLDSTEYKQFKDSFPDFYKYAVINNQILNHNDLWHIDLEYWHNLSNQNKEKIKQKKWIEIARLFKLNPGAIDGMPPFALSKYSSFYSQTDPFYDYIYQNDKIIGIILNDESGGRIEIPISID